MLLHAQARPAAMRQDTPFSAWCHALCRTLQSDFAYGHPSLCGAT